MTRLWKWRRQNLVAAKYLSYSCTPNDLKGCGIFIVAVPTPIDRANRPDLTLLIKASETVGSVMKNGAIVVYESTVYPGCTREVCVPALERISGLKLNEGFFVGYSPERINPGDRAHRLVDITKVTSGSTPAAAETIDRLYGKIIAAGTHKAASIEVAEAAKVIENTQRDLNIALMNEHRYHLPQAQSRHEGGSGGCRARNGISSTSRPAWWAGTASGSTLTT